LRGLIALTGIVEIAAFLLWLKTPFSTKYIVKKRRAKTEITSVRSYKRNFGVLMRGKLRDPFAIVKIVLRDSLCM
jgi:hypothetical protein